MSNIEKLQSYLVNYLTTQESKILMLSGTWGSGKTHFWHQAHENSIEYHLTKSEKPHIYISLYGKTSLKSIEDEVFIKAYNRSIDKNNDELNTIEKLSATFSSSSAISLVEKVTGFEIKDIINMINEKDKQNKRKDAKNFLNNLVICFDDFERKSKDVNLNDLFGFITNLSLEFDSNIVIILNDDVFDEEDKKTFYNVKEKSVNKFLKFNPSKEDLFTMIFGLYSIDKKYADILLKSIIEMDILNARVYKNIFENFEELIEKYPELTDSEIRFFVLSMINFNLRHKIFKFYDYPENFKNFKLPLYFLNLNQAFVKMISSLETLVADNNKCYNIKINLISSIKSSIESDYQTIEEPDKKVERKATEGLKEALNIFDKYSDDIWSFWVLEKILNFRTDVSIEKQRTINDFIENGYL